MKKACLVVQKPYNNNEIFNPSSPLNRDDCLKFFHELKAQFLQYNVDLSTQDLTSPEIADLVLYNEMPYDLKRVHCEKSAVLLFESELIRPDNWSPENHLKFRWIFTWNDTFVDGKKYFKFNFTHGGKTEFKRFSEKNRFCTLIAGNKSVTHPQELYSKRVEAIRWFEKFHPERFEFYGVGWGLYTFKVPVVSRFLNRLKPLRELFAEKWPSYKGPVKNKLELLKDFRFSICYENAHGIPGYITEKIFDSLAAGCIPVYWGAPNIRDFVPEDCFIDRTRFTSHEELYEYLTQMTESEYNRRLAAIQTYLSSSEHRLFEPQFNAEVVVKRILNV